MTVDGRPLKSLSRRRTWAALGRLGLLTFFAVLILAGPLGARCVGGSGLATGEFGFTPTEFNKTEPHATEPAPSGEAITVYSALITGKLLSPLKTGLASGGSDCDGVLVRFEIAEPQKTRLIGSTRGASLASTRDRLYSPRAPPIA